MSRSVKWGIIGLGEIAGEFASAFPTKEADLIAVGSRHLQKAIDFSMDYNVPKAYGNYHLLVRDPEVEVVYIATPNHRHATDILMCLKNGKHVLCEKSITLSTNQLEEAIHYAQKHDLWLAEAMTIYHMPLYQELEEYLASGKLGTVQMLSAPFGSKKEIDSTNRFFSKELGGGALFDIGVYSLAFIRRVLDDSLVTLSSSVNLSKTGVDEEALIQLQTKTGQLASAMLSFRSFIPRTASLICEKGYIEINDFSRADTATITFLDGTTETLTAGKREKAFNYELENMSHMILYGQDKSFLSYTQDVTEWMDALAKQWGMIF